MPQNRNEPASIKQYIEHIEYWVDKPALDSVLKIVGGASEIAVCDGVLTGPRCPTDERWCNCALARFSRRYGIDRRIREDEGLYYRWTKKDEIAFIERGDITASRNHRTGRLEAGLSVAAGPWYYRSYPRGYFLRGERIDIGADGEPILALDSLRPESMMTRRQMLNQFYAENVGLISRLSKQWGISEIALFLLLLGQPSGNYPEQPGDAATASQIL